MDYTKYWRIPNDLEKTLKEHSGLIITRFPPENSGHLHIGHAKALMINYVIAKKFNGLMILRFDDTNPLVESLEYETAIKEDIAKLNITPDITTYSSDYFPQLIKFADELVQNNMAYVDNTPQKISKEQRRNCIDSVNRNNSVDTNITLWNLMKDGTLKDCCLRIKTNMKHSVPNCRDPAIFRYIEEKHYRAPNSKIFPTYDFACPIIDSLEGVTHAFRSVEYSDRGDQYKIILSMLKLRKPKLFCYGKIKFEGVALSKRKIKASIEEGEINGWDDPRLFTLKGLLNHGLCLDALNQFVSTLGFSGKTPPIMTTEKLWAINRKIVDKTASRYFCIPRDNIMKIKVNNVVDFYKDIPKYIKNLDLGMRVLDCSNNIFIDKDDYNTFKLNEEITLMFWNNAYFDGNDLILNPTGDFKSTDKKIVWVSENHTVTIKINSCTTSGQIVSNYYIGEDAILNINKWDYVQFVKMNYYMCTNIDIDNRIVSFIELN